MMKTVLALAVISVCIMGIAAAAEANTLSGRCVANGDYQDAHFKDDGTVVTFWGLTFKNVKRRENKISGSVLRGDFIWSFWLQNNNELKLNVRLSPTSHYDAITGSSRTNWGHTCDLKRHVSPQSSTSASPSAAVYKDGLPVNDAVFCETFFYLSFYKTSVLERQTTPALQELAVDKWGTNWRQSQQSPCLTLLQAGNVGSLFENVTFVMPKKANMLRMWSYSSELFINKTNGQALLRGSRTGFKNIIEDIKKSQNLYAGILSFKKWPYQENHSKDDVSFHKVDRRYVVYEGIPSLEIDMTTLLKDLPVSQYYVLYLKSADGTYTWMRLRRAR